MQYIITCHIVSVFVFAPFFEALARWQKNDSMSDSTRARAWALTLKLQTQKQSQSWMKDVGAQTPDQRKRLIFGCYRAAYWSFHTQRSAGTNCSWTTMALSAVDLEQLLACLLQNDSKIIQEVKSVDLFPLVFVPQLIVCLFTGHAAAEGTLSESFDRASTRWFDSDGSEPGGKTALPSLLKCVLARGHAAVLSRLTTACKNVLEQYPNGTLPRKMLCCSCLYICLHVASYPFRNLFRTESVVSRMCIPSIPHLRTNPREHGTGYLDSVSQLKSWKKLLPVKSSSVQQAYIPRAQRPLPLFVFGHTATQAQSILPPPLSLLFGALFILSLWEDAAG